MGSKHALSMARQREEIRKAQGKKGGIVRARTNMCWRRAIGQARPKAEAHAAAGE